MDGIVRDVSESLIVDTEAAHRAVAESEHYTDVPIELEEFTQSLSTADWIFDRVIVAGPELLLVFYMASKSDSTLQFAIRKEEAIKMAKAILV